MPSQRVRHTTVMMMLRRTMSLMLSELMERLAAAGYRDLSPTFHPLFENIDPEGTRLTELAGRAGITHQSMSELVAILTRQGYLERRPDPSDARARLVCLTPEGMELLRVGLAEITAIETQWLERWRRAGSTADVRQVLESALAEAEGTPAQSLVK